MVSSTNLTTKNRGKSLKSNCRTIELFLIFLNLSDPVFSFLDVSTVFYDS
jgi:hypothetical protein